MLILSQRILRNEEVGIHTPLPAGLPSGIDEPGSGSRRGGRFRHRQTVKNSSISAQHSDFVATETFQLSVPAPSRALRKSNERSSRTIHEMPVLYCERYFASVRHDLSQSVASLRPDAHRPLPSHSADYLKFGILVI